MTYTINPNAKNVWIRDNEDTMDLSPITDANSVYLENGRTIEQELGEGSMVSNIATVDTSMSKIIDGTLDGAYESCVLKGRSLVNCVEQSMFEPKYTSRVETEGGFVYTQTEYQVATRLQFDYTQYSLLNNNTYYLISFELKVNKARILSITTDGTGYEGYGLQIEENTHVLIRQKIKFSPNGTVLRIYVRCKDGIDYTNDTFTLKNLMLIPYQEGMENWDIPYFEGLCDVKMPILRNVGKNLFDGELEVGKIGITGVNESVTDRVRCINFIRLKPNTVFYIKSNSVKINRMALYDSSKAMTRLIGTVANGYSFTTGKSEVYCRFDTQATVVEGINVQIEESPTSTQHEPHKSNTVHTPETVTLRSLPNGVRDELNLKTGEYVKRIGEVVLDGSETWKANNINNTTVCYYTRKVHGDGYKVRGGIICDTFTELPVTEFHLSPNEGFFSKHPSHNVFYLVVSKDRASSTSELLNYLSQNPITVQYELAEPITTKVSLTQSEPIVKIGTELPNGVCDTYNLLTGEHIQRVGKVVLDGSETWKRDASSTKPTDLERFATSRPDMVDSPYNTGNLVVSPSSYHIKNNDSTPRQLPNVWNYYQANIYMDFATNAFGMTTSDTADAKITKLKSYLQSNPVTVWYELKNPVITKKNGLPDTYGVALPNGVRDKYNESTGVYTQNIGRITFNGSEDWRQNQGGSYGFYCYHNESKDSSSFNCKELDAITGWNDYTQKGIFKGSVAWGVVVKSTDLTSCTVEAFKAWLKQNPITVEYEMVTPKTVDITPINVGQVLPNGVCDTYNPITKQYTKRVGFIALNGSEDWVKHTGDSNQYTYKTTNVLSGYKITSSYCDTMKTEVIDSGISRVYGYSFIRVGEVDASDGGDFGVFLHLEGGDIVQDVASLKTKLKLNPLNLWYELQTPEVTTVDLDLSTLYSANPIAYKDGHVILDSGYDGQSLLPVLEYSTITSRNQQIKSIGEQVLRQEKQLTMLEQMLIQNIIGMDYNNTLLTLNLEIDEVM